MPPFLPVPRLGREVWTASRRRHGRTRVAVAWLTVFVLLGAPPALRGQTAARACRTGQYAEYLRARFATLVAGVDAETVASRRMYALPAVPPEEVRVVTDEAICSRAARAYYRHRLGPPRGTGVAVVQVGDVYAVLGDERAGEWTILVVYNRAWQELARVGH